MNNPVLLQSLVMHKLRSVATLVQDEGWSWVWSIKVDTVQRRRLERCPVVRTKKRSGEACTAFADCLPGTV